MLLKKYGKVTIVDFVISAGKGYGYMATSDKHFHAGIITNVELRLNTNYVHTSLNFEL
jgi:hypothetical protein